MDLISRKSFCGYTLKEFMLLFHTIGLEESLAEKTLTAFYRSRITDFSRYNFLRKETRLFISKNYHKGLYPPVSSEKSGDGTEKFLFRNPDGLEFESVFIPEERRQTLCVSVQSGCRMGCPFCITGRLPYRGNLSAGDIINQLLSVPVSAQITHVVFMGMGEPLDNFAQVLKACEILSAQWGLAIAASKVTVSTVGILPEMETFLKESVCNLTLSLFSPFQEERAGILPAARIYGLI
jgi:23S rRNA (adenine2503-C2)-methyltransferase